MKPAMPAILRRGAVIRVAGPADASDRAALAYAVTFVDLRFDDGHVERWLGVGELRDTDPVPYERLVSWGVEVAQEHSMSGDLRMEFSNVDREALDNADLEIVVEWNASLPTF